MFKNFSIIDLWMLNSLWFLLSNNVVINQVLTKSCTFNMVLNSNRKSHIFNLSYLFNT